MGKLLTVVIGWALSSFLLKLTTTIGIGVLTYKSLEALVSSFLDLISPLAQGLPADILSILAIAGVPEALTVISSALLTRAAIKSATAFVGAIT